MIGQFQNHWIRQEKLILFIISSIQEVYIDTYIYCSTMKIFFFMQQYICLLYTSDAADDMQCVDLGGRRIIKKKKKKISNRRSEEAAYNNNKTQRDRKNVGTYEGAAIHKRQLS
eukprot:TRINITY_DN3320_c0_g1_i7.p2 TRINITY_DN3320_c0_g1~~TRINITY_DN3320_c0_g1_i7.p2  ORF type:complete len:114 (-),score=19.07 TRINITY_DN3320_c0_g1_i7:3-344(-)